MKKHSIAEVWGAANSITAEIDQWIALKDNRPVRFRFKPLDQARLLRLRVWSIRYYVSIGEILTLVVPVLRGQIKSKRKGFGLGVSVRTLVGDAAERILQQEIKKRYPENEHIAVWRAEERRRQIHEERVDALDGLQPREQRLPDLLDCSSVKEYVRLYRERIVATRGANRSLNLQKWRKRKAYRWNPWI